MNEAQVLFIFALGIIMGMAVGFYVGWIGCRIYYFAIEVKIREWFLKKLRGYER